LNVLDLFSGIGGFSLGLERAGFRTVAFCEIDPYCRRVLAKHWPGVPIFEDVTKLRGTDVGTVDLICGGFPCQDISIAGKGAGISGSRSGLWTEFHRLIGEIRPRYVIVENVPALLQRGLGKVLGDLAEIGYDAEWDCIPASYVGCRQLRDRIWIVAYPECHGLQGGGGRISPRRGKANPEKNNWQDWCSLVLGQRYPVPETAELVMGFPTGHTEIELSETPSFRKSRKS
jgi:DNA (cytosine-5)-methyltransferase 1